MSTDLSRRNFLYRAGAEDGRAGDLAAMAKACIFLIIRAVADLALSLFNTNEFVYVY